MKMAIEKLVVAVVKGETLVLSIAGELLKDIDREDGDRSAEWWVPEGTPILDHDGIWIWEGEPKVEERATHDNLGLSEEDSYEELILDPKE